MYTVHRPCCARASVACAHGSLTTEAFAGYGFLRLLFCREKLECRLLLPFHRGQPVFFPRPSRANTHTHTHARTHSLPGESVCGLPDPRSGINHNVEGQGRTSSEPDLSTFLQFSSKGVRMFSFFLSVSTFLWITEELTKEN